MSTTTWVSPINAAYGLTTDGTYIYVSNTLDVPGEGYGSYINSYKISDKTTSSYLLAASNNTIGPLTIGTYLYASYTNENQPLVATINYPTMTSAGITFAFSSYQDENEQNVNPVTSAIVIAGNYLYASFIDGFLGRCVLQTTVGTYGNESDFGSTNNFYYGPSGYNNLNNTLSSSDIPTALATDDTYLYVGCSGKIVRMTLSTVSGGTTDAANWLSSGFSGITGLTVSSDKVYLYVLSNSASTIKQVQLSDGSILSTYSLGASYANSLYNGIVSNESYLYAAYYGTGGDQNNGSILRYGASDPSPSVPCFGENTKILCFNSEKSEEEYIQIKDIRKGTLVKTVMNGYVAVDAIGKSTIHSYANNERIKNRLYKCTKENYPEIVEDLILTGCHSILVDYLTEEQREKTIEELQQVYITDRKYRLFTFLDPHAEPYQVAGELPIYHFALENENFYMNYGVYANGLLVESCSKRYLKNISGMTLIE
jgi:hypothetical protein